MNCRELMVNIRETYKDSDDRLEKAYLGEFGNNYSSSKLDKIWDCIQENHIFAKAPELGNIFKYMAMLGIPRTKDQGTFYNRCTELKLTGEKDDDGDDITIECGTKYSLRSKFCPVCNIAATIAKPVINTLEIMKCNVLPNDLKVLNELCGTCSKYHTSSQVRGARCNAWGSHDDYRKSNKNCAECCCFDCCNEKPMKAYQRDALKIKRV